MKKPIVMISLLLGLVSAGCKKSSSTNSPSTRPAGPATLSTAIGGKTYTLEIAADGPSQSLGLMDRDHLAPDHGMIFVFPDSAERGFWMKNTLIPLDIAFIAANGKVVSTHTMKALDQTTTPSNGDAKYAIELNAGELAKDGIKKGDQIMIPPAADAALKK